MATYLYETTDPDQPVEQFEIQQSMRDEPLRYHPVTGVAVRRVISGGFGVITKGSGGTPAPGLGGVKGGAVGGGSCGVGCGCH